MNSNYAYSEIQRLTGPANKILICLPKNVTFDEVAAGLSLYLVFTQNGKNVSIVAPEPMTVGLSHLVGLDKIAEKLEGRNLLLTINAPIAEIETVSTTDDGQHLSVVIVPKKEAPAITKEQISFSGAQAQGDLIMTVGVRKLEGLGRIVTDNQDLFNQKPIINFDNSDQNTNFGRLNIVDPQASTLSEMVVAIINGLTLPLDEDVAGNLLQGLKVGTNNFQDQKVRAETFEAASLCLKVGKAISQASKIEEPPSDWMEPKIYKGSTIS